MILNKKNRFLILLLFLFVIISCKPKDNAIALPDLTKEQINGASLWKRITVDSYYEHYPMWPDHAGRQLGMSPHGRYHEVFINRKLIDAVPNKERMAPYGSLCVKENFTAGNDLVSITAMAKVQGYNPEFGDWFWVMYDRQGKVMDEGKIQMCINCHIGSNNDYITIQKLDKPLNKAKAKP